MASTILQALDDPALFAPHNKHFGQDGDVLVWQADSRTMHPGLSAELLAEAFEDDAEAAA